MDYRSYELSRDQRSDLNAKPPKFPADGKLTISLTGATPIHIRIVNEASEPMSGVRVYPWLFQNRTEAGELNTSALKGCFVDKTNSDGEVTLKWIPNRQSQGITFWASKDGFEHNEAATIPPKTTVT